MKATRHVEQYDPKKTYYFIGARSANDNVPIGLFPSYDEALRNNPINGKAFIKKASHAQIIEHFGLE